VCWLKSGLCYYTLTIACHTETVELSEIYYSVEPGGYTSRQLVAGPGDRRRSWLRMLKKLLDERGVAIGVTDMLV
jgi:hypothetical protein